MARKLAALVLALIVLTTIGALPALAEEPVHLLLIMSNTKETDMQNHNIQDMMKELNVTLEVISCESTDVLNQQINTLLIADDLPDICCVKTTEYPVYYSTGAFLSLNELLDTYGKDLLEAIPQSAWETASYQGDIYGVPLIDFAAKYCTAIRADWLRNLGYEVKETYTVNEIKEILHAFTYNDPDGNGKKDTIGMGYANAASVSASFQWLFGTMNGAMGQYYVDAAANEFYAYDFSDDLYNALLVAREMWADGVIDPELFVQTRDSFVAKAATGAIGFFHGWWSRPGEIIKAGLEANAPGAEFEIINVTDETGKVWGDIGNGEYTGLTMISANSKNPEKAMELLNWMGQYENSKKLMIGTEGIEYQWRDSADIYKGYTTLDTAYPVTANWMINIIRNDAWQRDNLRITLNSLEPSSQFNIVYVKERAIQARDDYQLYTTCTFGLGAPDAYLEYGAEVSTYINAAITSFIIGEKELTPESWAAYRTEACNRGMRDILKGYTELYNNTYETNLTARVY